MHRWMHRSRVFFCAVSTVTSSKPYCFIVFFAHVTVDLGPLSDASRAGCGRSDRCTDAYLQWIYCDVRSSQGSPKLNEAKCRDKDMQMKYDLLYLLRRRKSLRNRSGKKTMWNESYWFHSKTKAWNPFLRGKNGRDAFTELFVPKHIVQD